MEVVGASIAAVSSPLNEAGLWFAHVNAAAIVALCLPTVVALLSRRLLTIVTTLVLAGSAVVASSSPSAVGMLIALGTFVGAFLVALSALIARRYDRTIVNQIRILKTEVDELASGAC